MKFPADKKFLNNITVSDIAEGGKGLGRSDEMVIFIESAIPGDVVDVEIMRRQKKYYEGRVREIIKPSDFRTEPFCQHFGPCGGCKWQHMDYQSQLTFKQKSVTDALQRLAKADTSGMETILPSAATRYYRNKLEYTFSDKRWLTNEDMENRQTAEMNALGYHIPGRFDKILDIEHCHLQADPSNGIRNELRSYALEMQISFYDLKAHQGALRNLIIRNTSTGELMVIVVFAFADEDQRQGVMAFLAEKFPQISSLLYIINQKKNDTIFDQQIEVYKGADHIFERMPSGKPGGEDLKFKIGAKSFYQTNSAQAHELYKIAREFAGFTGDELVYDLYTGAGTIANFIAADVRNVIGIEYVPSAVDDAYINSEINNIGNTKFFAGDMKDVLNEEFINVHGRPDVIITDPPRAGMHPDVTRRLLEIEAAKIVYVSCNAATQARDIALLMQKYEVSRIRPVDMFPHTQHVENVVLLTLNKSGKI